MVQLLFLQVSVLVLFMSFGIPSGSLFLAVPESSSNWPSMVSLVGELFCLDKAGKWTIPKFHTLASHLSPNATDYGRGIRHLERPRNMGIPEALPAREFN
jgi:hypothetical protein